MGTLIVGIILLVIIVLIIKKIIKDKKNGESSCGLDCASCGGACNNDKND